MQAIAVQITMAQVPLRQWLDVVLYADVSVSTQQYG